MGKIDYVIYGRVAHFGGEFHQAGYVVDGVWYHTSDPAEAKAYAEAHPDKWIRASTHPACGVAYIMPEGAPHQITECGRMLPFPFNDRIRLTLDEARELPSMEAIRYLVEVTCINPNDENIPAQTWYKFVPADVFKSLKASKKCEAYTEHNKRYDVVTGSCGNLDLLEDFNELFMSVGVNDDDAMEMGWTMSPLTAKENDDSLRMLILFDD